MGMPPKQPARLSRGDSSAILLPAVRIRTRTAVLYSVILLVFVVATVDTMRTFVHDFVIHERALLTSRGRERFRARRRTYDRLRMCDETDEPTFARWWWRGGWRALSSCVEYDLSLRRRPLGDEGTRRLVRLLGRREYAARNVRGRLRALNLERQGITRRGAGYLARWLGVDPEEADEGTAGTVDVERLPTAASRSLFVNLRGNPIGPLGVKVLERAVDKARINGIKVVIVGGGESFAHGLLGASGRRQTGRHVHMVKLGPIEYTRKAVEMQPWRLPVPWHQRLMEKVEARSIASSAKALIVFCVGFAIGRASVGTIPYRLMIVRDDGGG